MNRFDTPSHPHGSTPHRRVVRLVGMLAAAAMVTFAAGCSSGGVVVVTVTPTASQPATPAAGAAGGSASAPVAGTTTAGQSTSASTSTASATAPTTSATPTPVTKPVHVATFEGDGQTYGVGIAVMAMFTVAPTDATAFKKATTVTVNGKPASGAWYWQDSIVPGYKTEALYREKDYWPADSTVAVDMPVKGLSAGTGLVYDDSLTLTFQIGDAHISHVNNKEHTMTVTSNDTVVKNFPISLGYASTPTYDGVKVVMTKGSVDPKTGKPYTNGTVEMKSDPGEKPSYDLLVPWSVRITNSGEFIHSAKWNGKNIGSVNTSHGCTNLNPDDAEWFYNFSLPGDVVDYPDANPSGTVQPSWDGWGWWNVPWSEWQQGGLLTVSS